MLGRHGFVLTPTYIEKVCEVSQNIRRVSIRMHAVINCPLKTIPSVRVT